MTVTDSHQADAPATKAAWAICRACRAASSPSTCRCCVFVFVLLFPFYWMAITAVKPNEQLTNFNDFSPFWVVDPTLEHISYLLFETSYPGWLWNTMLISTASTFLSLFAAVFAAYAIERLRFTGARAGRAWRSSSPIWCRPRSCSSRSR